MTTEFKTVERWYCAEHKTAGPWYDSGDRSIAAGWAVHLGQSHPEPHIAGTTEPETKESK